MPLNTCFLILFQEDTSSHPQPLKPNPKNLTNLSRIAELEQQISRLVSDSPSYPYNPKILQMQTADGAPNLETPPSTTRNNSSPTLTSRPHSRTQQHLRLRSRLPMPSRRTRNAPILPSSRCAFLHRRNSQPHPARGLEPRIRSRQNGRKRPHPRPVSRGGRPGRQ